VVILLDANTEQEVLTVNNTSGHPTLQLGQVFFQPYNPQTLTGNIYIANLYQNHPMAT